MCLKDSWFLWFFYIDFVVCTCFGCWFYFADTWHEFVVYNLHLGWYFIGLGFHVEFWIFLSSHKLDMCVNGRLRTNCIVLHVSKSNQMAKAKWISYVVTRSDVMKKKKEINFNELILILCVILQLVICTVFFMKTKNKKEKN